MSIDTPRTDANMIEPKNKKTTTILKTLFDLTKRPIYHLLKLE